MPLKTLTISLHNSSKTYSPGEIVSGDVILELNRTTVYQGLKLEFNGLALVHWEESDGEDKVSYWGSEEYFCTSVYLFGSPGCNSQVEAGRHEFPFTFPLPPHIPSTFSYNLPEFHLGSIEYTIKAILCREQRYDPKTYIHFYVNSPPDLRQYPTEPIVDETNMTYCCCLLPCISQGSMNASIRAMNNAYAVGEDIIVFVDFHCNSKSVHVTSVDLKLEQEIKFMARTPKVKNKYRRRVLAESIRRGPLPSTANLEMKMKVPSVDHTGFQHCGIIAIKYLLVVKIRVSGCHSNTTRRYDITIGSRTPLPTNTTAPSAPLNELLDMLSSALASSERSGGPLQLGSQFNDP